MTAAAETIGKINRAESAEQESQARIIFRRFRRHRLAMISTVLILIVFGASLLAPVITTFSRDAVDISTTARPAPPGTLDSQGRLHIFGVDHLGRDLFTRVLYAAASRCRSCSWWFC